MSSKEDIGLSVGRDSTPALMAAVLPCILFMMLSYAAAVPFALFTHVFADVERF